MNTELTRIIEAYLSQELSESDRIAFEKRLKDNPTLQEEVRLQQLVREGSKRGAQRAEIKQTARKFHLQKTILWTGLILLTASLVAGSVFVYQASQTEKYNSESELDANQLSQMEQDKPLDLVPAQYFSWKGNDDFYLTEKGVLLSIPQKAFMLDGKIYQGEATIQWQEALDVATIVKAGLETKSGDRLLETQGMMGFQAFTPDGKKLDVNPQVGVYVQVPVDEYKAEMQLFEGVKSAEEVDWQNPQKLAKIPVPISMKDLDFYPSKYEKTLDELRARKDKKYRDSLYASLDDFDGIQTVKEENLNKYASNSNPIIAYPRQTNTNKYVNYNADTVFNYYSDQKSIGKSLFDKTCFSCHTIGKNATGPNLYKVREKWSAGGAKDGSIYTWVRDWQKSVRIDPYAEEVMYISQLNHRDFPNLKNEEIDAIFDWIDSQLNYIPPSAVLGFWKPKMENTNLATREFERRMREIHQTCDKSVLALYVQNLNKGLSEVDQLVVKKGYSQFQRFVDEQVGAVNPSNPHLTNLKAFYEQAVASIRQEATENTRALRKKQQEWDDKTAKIRSEEQIRTNERVNQAFEEEVALNHGDVRRQIARSVGFTIVNNVNAFNLDRYVRQATAERKTASITNDRGEKIEIKYNDFQFAIQDDGKYKQLFAYLFPDKINAFERISRKSGTFSYPLNDLQTYHLAIVGMNESGYFFYQKTFVKGGNLGTISLESIGETKLNASLEQLNAQRGILVQPMRFEEEMAYLIHEQKNYVEQRKRKDHYAFVQRLKTVVFPCMNSYSGVSNIQPEEIHIF